MSSKFFVGSYYPKVLSVQSTVVHGYVGNKASVFGLHAIGLEVDPLFTCQFSNHSGYPVCTGIRVSGDDLHNIVDGLKQNDVLQCYTHMITGYVAAESFLKEIPMLIEQIKCAHLKHSIRHGFLFLCDPVMGDNDSMYVPTAYREIYRDTIVPLAHILTPNQTEASLLTGVKITSFRSAGEACKKLHQMGPRLIVITSMSIQEDSQSNHLAEYTLLPEHDQKEELAPMDAIGHEQSSNPLSDADFDLFVPGEYDAQIIQNCLGAADPMTAAITIPQCLLDDVHKGLAPTDIIYVFISINIQDTTRQWYFRLPKFAGYVSGTGDLSSALILAQLQKNKAIMSEGLSLTDPRHVLHSVTLAMASIHAVVRCTIIRCFVGEHIAKCPACQQKSLDEDDDLFLTPQMTKPVELWMPGARSEIESPSFKITAHALDSLI